MMQAVKKSLGRNQGKRRNEQFRNDMFVRKKKGRRLFKAELKRHGLSYQVWREQKQILHSLHLQILPGGNATDLSWHTWPDDASPGQDHETSVVGEVPRLFETLRERKHSLPCTSLSWDHANKRQRSSEKADGKEHLRSSIHWDSWDDPVPVMVRCKSIEVLLLMINIVLLYLLQHASATWSTFVAWNIHKSQTHSLHRRTNWVASSCPITWPGEASSLDVWQWLLEKPAC